VTVVDNCNRPDGTTHHFKTLEEECLGNETLPGLAYGFRGCSRKWKVQPMDRWIRHQEWAQTAWEKGASIERWIGYDADETHRANLQGDHRFCFRYPLVEWGVGREDCRRIIAEAGLPVPTKSACFFCPAMKKHEIIALAKERPDVFRRALAMEDAAQDGNTTVKGLGRNYSWRALWEADEAQRDLFPEDSVDGCVICWDGEGEMPAGKEVSDE